MNDAYRAALRGDLSLEPLGPEPREPNAFRALLESVWDLFAPSVLLAGDPSRVLANPTSERDAALLVAAAGHVALARMVRFDFDGWRAARERQEELAVVALHDFDATLAVGRAWSAWMAGDTSGASDWLRSVMESRRELPTEEAHLLVEATSLAALVALSARSLGEATQLARRAARMARTEELLPYEYFAGLVLARVRRYSERPHLSLRILDALSRVVPPTWTGYVRFERILAGKRTEREGFDGEAANLDATPSGRVATALTLALDAARTGNRMEVDASTELLERALAPCRDLFGEVTTVVGCLDPEVPIHDLEPEAARWATGQLDVAPGAIQGLAFPEVKLDGLERSGAVVVLRDGHTPRRILREGAGLLRGLCDADSGDRDAMSDGTAAKPAVLAAALALAGRTGLTDDALFEALYGFRYTPEKHLSILRNLVYRAREILGEGAAIERREGRYVIERKPGRVVVLPDPRCTAELSELVLRVLASRGGLGTARDVAAALRVPLRTVQAALGDLVSEGACESEREGRRIAYRVEDTTFGAPTMTRLSPRASD